MKPAVVLLYSLNNKTQVGIYFGGDIQECDVVRNAISQTAGNLALVFVWINGLNLVSVGRVAWMTRAMQRSLHEEQFCALDARVFNRDTHHV